MLNGYICSTTLQTHIRKIYFGYYEPSSSSPLYLTNILFLINISFRQIIYDIFYINFTYLGEANLRLTHAFI